jgi:hypothetical protein
MRFLMLYRPAKPEGQPPSQREMEEMGKFIEITSKEGSLLYTEGCQSSSTGARVRLANKTVKVNDGPFTETKEIIGGFAIIRAKSKAEAIELAKRFLDVAGDGETEIRLLHEAPAFAHQEA